jgi:hypothetical protein
LISNYLYNPVALRLNSPLDSGAIKSLLTGDVHGASLAASLGARRERRA